ncbi:MAG: hypothetical protein AB1521_13760 [Bacteroidota bacterium]
MEIKGYNDEMKFSELKSDLKNLPKISAPDNFEYNLYTKIQNKSFADLTEQRGKFSFVKFFAPSAIVVTALIAFFIFLPNSDQQLDNPLMSEPQEIASSGQKVVETIQNDNTPNREVSATPNSNSVRSQNPSKASPNTNFATNQERKYPINRKQSVAVDEFISGDNKNNSDIRQGNVVNSGTGSDEFDGFFVREQPDQKTLEKYRAMIDSVKRAQAKEDSLKKAKKTR